VVVGRFAPLGGVDAADLGRIVARHLPVVAVGGQEVEHEVLIRLKIRHSGSGVVDEPFRGAMLVAAQGMSPGADCVEILTGLGHAQNGQPKHAQRAGVAQVVPGEKSLTDREVGVLKGLSEGLSNREIAERLHITPGTVHSHVRKIFRKLGVHDRRALSGIQLPDREN
jgi:DNA-binding CsgD family transcriptional regulator